MGRKSLSFQADITHLFLLKGISNAQQFLGENKMWHDGVFIPVPVVLSSAQGGKLILYIMLREQWALTVPDHADFFLIAEQGNEGC